MTGGMRLLRCRLNELKDARHVYAAVRACAAAEPKGTWLLGGGWSPEAFAPRGPSVGQHERVGFGRHRYGQLRLASRRD